MSPPRSVRPFLLASLLALPACGGAADDGGTAGQGTDTIAPGMVTGTTGAPGPGTVGTPGTPAAPDPDTIDGAPETEPAD